MMDISQLKDELLNNKLRPSYLFIGDELAIQDIYVNKICELSGLEGVKIDTLKNVYNKLTSRTLVKVKPKVYIIRNDEFYAKDDKVWEKVISGKSLGKNIIIFKYTDIDKRGKFYKEHESIITEFNFVSDSLLSNRVQAITKWPIEYCRDLVNLCGCNYGRICNEIENIKILAKVENCSMNTAYVIAKESNMIHEEIGDIIFDFTNAIVERDITKSYTLLNKIKQTDEGPIKLLSVLYNSFRNVMIVQSTPQNQRTEEILGLSKGQIYVTSQKCNKYNIYEVVSIVKLIQKIESGIKTGEIDQNYAMDYLLGEIF